MKPYKKELKIAHMFLLENILNKKYRVLKVILIKLIFFSQQLNNHCSGVNNKRDHRPYGSEKDRSAFTS